MSFSVLQNLSMFALLLVWRIFLDGMDCNLWELEVSGNYSYMYSLKPFSKDRLPVGQPL